MKISREQLERLSQIYYLYLDECGHATYKSKISYSSPNERFLTLAGILLRGDIWWNELERKLDKLKEEHFGESEIFLHYTDIARAKGPFKGFSQDQKMAFWGSFLDMLGSIDCQLISITIDKQRIQEIYKVYQDNPYHLSLALQIERLIYTLGYFDKQSNQAWPFRGKVIIESRDDVHDNWLKEAYERIYKNSSPRYFTITAKDVQRRLGSKEIAICSKKEGKKGLEVADLICNPMHWNTLFEYCPEILLEYGVHGRSESVEAFWNHTKVRSKIASDHTGEIKGFGMKFLPDKNKSEPQ